MEIIKASYVPDVLLGVCWPIEQVKVIQSMCTFNGFRLDIASTLRRPETPLPSPTRAVNVSFDDAESVRFCFFRDGFSDVVISISCNGVLYSTLYRKRLNDWCTPHHDQNSTIFA